MTGPQRLEDRVFATQHQYCLIHNNGDGLIQNINSNSQAPLPMCLPTLSLTDITHVHVTKSHRPSPSVQVIKDRGL